jgi:hypothetical protein
MLGAAISNTPTAIQSRVLACQIRRNSLRVPGGSMRALAKTWSSAIAPGESLERMVGELEQMAFGRGLAEWHGGRERVRRKG